jgi:tetratricopeptide (TPR) repeat protein
MFNIAGIIGLVIFGLFALLNLIGIFRRLIVASRSRKFAKINVGDEVSIYTDVGARNAYKGIYAFYNNDFSRALIYLEKSLKDSTVSQNNAFCLDWISQCYDAQEKPEESLRCSVQAVNAEPSNIKSLFNLADSYARMGLFSKAEFYYNRILQYDSENIAAIFMLGTLFMGRGNYEQAELQFKKTLDVDGKFSAALAELSIIMAIKGDYSKMDSYYVKAADSDYNESERLKNRLNSIKKMQGICSLQGAGNDIQ